MRIKVNTKAFGEIDVDEIQIIDFPQGILGFDFIKKFIIMDTEDEGSPFKWMQAFDEKDLAFVIVRPLDFMEEYELIISQNDLDEVKSESIDELVTFSIVTIPENPRDMTANLQGPIIINPVKRIGKQAISLSDRYTVRHNILDEMKKNRKAGE
ncbi:MAG: flagellar assembly protein FliW [Spirochaetes bacterium]|nr:flagellar assembly protein FliW [Spirochaetota bacterium]